MAEAARQASVVDRPTWIMADRQTGGRGRSGRSWEGSDGNLYATLIYHPGCTPQAAAQRSFMAAIALFETLAMYVPRGNLSLKWPNDVLLDGGKVAGILLESAGTGPFVDWLAVGIGVNLAVAPPVDGAAFPPVSLAEAAKQEIDAGRFLARLAGHFQTQEKKLDTFGFARIREDWLRHAARLGEVITARTPREEVTGTFDSLDEAGNLVLVTADGPQVIAAADVYFERG